MEWWRRVRANVSHTSTGLLPPGWRCRPPVLKIRAVRSNMKEGVILAPHRQVWPSTQLKLPTFLLDKHRNIYLMKQYFFQVKIYVA